LALSKACSRRGSERHTMTCARQATSATSTRPYSVITSARLSPYVVSSARRLAPWTSRSATPPAMTNKIIVVGMWSRKRRHGADQDGIEQHGVSRTPLRRLDFASRRGSRRHTATSTLGGF
jgi:hypothetical protein